MKKINVILVFVVLTISLFFHISCSLFGANGTGDDDKDTTHNEMLQGLGVNTNAGVRENPAGEEVPADYNPTMKPITPLAKRSEIFLAGTTGQGADVSFFPDGTVSTILDWPDDASNFSPTGLYGDDSWLKLPKAMASGDFDGDGIDEIFVAYYRTSNQAGYDKELVFKVIENNQGIYTEVTEKTIAAYLDSSISEYPSSDWWMNNFTAVSGDVDGNGQYETLVAFNGSVFLIGDSYKDYGIIQSITYSKSSDTRYKLLKISAGDLNNDGTDEFVVVENSLKDNVYYGTAIYHMYAGVTLNELESGNIIVTEGATTVTLHAANCAVGDLDGDGLNEVLFIGEPENNGNYYLMILDQVWDSDTGEFEYSFMPDFEYFASRNSVLLTPICAIADFDGDGKKEFLGYRYMYDNLSETGGSFDRKTGVTDIYAPTNAGALGSAWDYSLAVGDIDGDLKADITYITDSLYEMYCLGFNDAGQWVRKGSGNINDSYVYYPAVVMGDFDGDSIVVEFVESEILFSNPHPIAVLASNPYWTGIDMDGSTSFGTSLGNEVEKEKSIGFSVGFSVGYESEGPFSLWKASVKTSFEASFDWTATESVSIEESYTYSTSNEDKVIFTTIPYDVYYYKVIQAPDTDMVDTVITVNLPRKAVTLPVEVGYYNSHNGGAPDIDSTVLTHTVGDPLSYPSPNEADVLIASGGGQGLKSTNMLTVGQGTEGSAIELSVTNSSGSGFAFDFSVTIEAEFGVGGATAGVSAGFHYGESYTVTTSSGMIYGGEVANIPADDWNLDKSFSWGLFSYRGSVGSEKFIVVQYYTERI